MSSTVVAAAGGGGLLFDEHRELEHVVRLFDELRRYPKRVSIVNDGPWLTLVQRLRNLLKHRGFALVEDFTASDITHEIDCTKHAHIRYSVHEPALECLQCMLVNNEPHD